MNASLTTVRNVLPQFRVADEASLYCLRHRRQFSNYHQVHVEQMGYLHKLTGDPFYETFGAVLWADHPYDGR